MSSVFDRGIESQRMDAPATAAKVAIMLKGRGRSPFLVPADVYRPAAVDQLRVLGRDNGIAVFSEDQIEAADRHLRGLATDPNG